MHAPGPRFNILQCHVHMHDRTSCHPLQAFILSAACPSPVIHAYGIEADSLSVESINAQDLANWAGVFEAYGEVIQQIIVRDIPTEQKAPLESLYTVISAVLMDYNQVVSYIWLILIFIITQLTQASASGT